VVVMVGMMKTPVEGWLPFRLEHIQAVAAECARWRSKPPPFMLVPSQGRTPT
jgi:hypothetical protein